jgi:isoleucyl-tRNA synthetase
MSADYKDTLFLPRTDFPMKAGLAKREPELLARWASMNLWDKLRTQSKGREPFTLHDGPPYANGHLHIGHALNKILKDVINRSEQMQGRDANYVPGWDCHGLPIEWKIEEKYRAAGQDKDEVPINEFRAECREFAAHWIDIQREEFKRMGVMGDWDHPYLTMAFEAEAKIAGEIGKFLMNGGLFKGSKPVLWSVVEKTALAEAEVEYMDHKSPMIWARFPVVKTNTPLMEGAAIVIWTTTPWTIPGNRGVACHVDFEYSVFDVTEVTEGSRAKIGERLAVATALIDVVCEKAGITGHAIVGAVMGGDLDGDLLAHPWRGQGYDFDVLMMNADFVTDDAGTGFVHVAPGHGADDFVLGSKHGLEIPRTVAEDGTYYPGVPMFEDKRVLTEDGKEGDANGNSIRLLDECGALLAKGSIRHSYPHSWRSKAPLIFRNTSQWFISMAENNLRDTALRAISETRFVPEGGRNRLHAMIESRPDWCISRQRAWGVPIPVFVDKRTGGPLRDQAVIDRIVEAFTAEGADCWYSSPPERFLGDAYDPDNYEKVTDVVDVWFDSGSTHCFVLEERDDLHWPASLYLEGSDQHRGWFHSSLLESCGTRGRAPYDAVLTHGFVMAEDGRKMSKSLGNVVEPQKVADQFGIETLRLWVVASDYSEDLKIGPEIIKRQVDAYRRLRNTLRWLLGNLGGFDAAKRVDVADMPELERWVLHRLSEMDVMVRTSCAAYDFHHMFRELHDFCAVDLSAFYFDIRKDSLYCDGPDAPSRLAALTVLDALFNCLTAWFAPILCFTAEEAWLSRTGDTPDNSVHLRQFPGIPTDWRNEALGEKWIRLRAIRRAITGAIEIKRAKKEIRSSLQATADVYLNAADKTTFDNTDAAELAITSALTLIEAPAPDDAFTLDDVDGVGVVVHQADGEKCERCWRILPDIDADPDVPGACGRCADVIRDQRVAVA